jgi:hypothetical protein
MYDRLSGSTTMVISSGGTTVPGTPARPEYLKADVYLPPAFVAHHPDLHCHLVNIIQHYIETVGVRTVIMWSQRARRDLGYSLTQNGNPKTNPLVNAIPSPDYNSAHYAFFGQPYRITEDPSFSSLRPPSPAGSTDSYAHAFGEDPDPSSLIILDLQEENHVLREKIDTFEQKIRDLQDQLNFTNSSRTTQHRDRVIYLEEQIKRSAPSTPVRNLTTKPQTPRSPFRNGSLSPSRAAPSHSQIPPGYSSPISPFPFGSTHGSPSVSHTGYTLDNTQHGVSLLPQLINRYHIGHLSMAINLISNYAPVETRKEELTKLGLEEKVCDTLAEAMALDKGTS